MTMRGFSSSKSAEANRTNNTTDEESPDSSNGTSASLTPPQVFGHRKKLTDLKIDFNFVPNKNNKLKSTHKNGLTIVNGNLPSPGSKTPQPKIRGVNTTYGK